MQPMPNPELVMLVHREMINSELRRRTRWQDDRPLPKFGSLFDMMRRRFGTLLVVVGEWIDPTAARYPQPGAGR